MVKFNSLVILAAAFAAVSAAPGRGNDALALDHEDVAFEDFGRGHSGGFGGGFKRDRGREGHGSERSGSGGDGCQRGRGKEVGHSGGHGRGVHGRGQGGVESMQARDAFID